MSSKNRIKHIWSDTLNRILRDLAHSADGMLRARVSYNTKRAMTLDLQANIKRELVRQIDESKWGQP